MTETNIFISYSRSDSDFVIKLEEDLARAGVFIWLDQKMITSGKLWDRAIEEALESSRILIVVVSSKSALSENVANEVQYARDEGKIIIPILIEDPIIPLILQRYQVIDFYENYKKGLNELARTLKYLSLMISSETEKGEQRLKEKAEAKVKAAEVRRIKAASEAKQNAEEERIIKAKAGARKIEEEKRIKEALRLKEVEEAKRKSAEEQRLKEKAEAKVKAAEVRRIKAASEAKQNAEEERRIKAKVGTRKIEEEKRIKEALRLKEVEEAKRKSAEEQRLKEEAESKAKAEEDMRIMDLAYAKANHDVEKDKQIKKEADFKRIEESKVFVSYSREDSFDFAMKLCKDLKSKGINVWLDKMDIKPSENWPDAIERSLKSCNRFLIILSTISVSSPEVKRELNYALNKSKVIIPVKFHNCEIPYRIDDVQFSDFTKDYDEGFRDLLRAFQSIIIE